MEKGEPGNSEPQKRQDFRVFWRFLWKADSWSLKAYEKEYLMAVKKFSSAYYVVKNMDESVAFYKDVIGLNVKFRDGNRWTQFDVNGVGVALADPSEGSVPPGGGATVVLEVDDLMAMRTQLTQQGIAVNDIVDMGGHGKYFTTKDPSGNIVQIFARS